MTDSEIETWVLVSGLEVYFADGLKGTEIRKQIRTFARHIEQATITKCVKVCESNDYGYGSKVATHCAEQIKSINTVSKYATC